MDCAQLVNSKLDDDEALLLAETKAVVTMMGLSKGISQQQ